MTNRKIAILILIAMFSAIGYGIYYYFIRNVSEINVAVRWPQTAVASLMKGNANVLSVECEWNCSITKVPPFDYELVVKAEGYVTYTEALSLRTNDKIYRVIELERDVTTVAYQADRKEAIAEIRSKRAILAEEGASVNGREYYGQFRWFDYFSDKLPEFKLVSRDSEGKDETVFNVGAGVDPKIILGEEGALWINAEGASSLFDLKTWERLFPAFPSGITKVGRGLRTWTFIVADQSWAYTYDKISKSLDKVALYSDFVPFEDGKIVALIRKGDDKRASLLNLWNSDSSYVFTDRSAGNRRVIYSTEQDVRNIHRHGTGSVVLEYADGSKETLTNFE